jgi:vacuolar-type H+-ATPase subunit E/Vma4
VGYRELLAALEEEVSRQIGELRAEAARERERILDEARAELTVRRERVLAEERRQLAEDAARAMSGARLEQQRALLGEMRRQLAELRREAEASLASLNDAELLARLVEEIVPELGDGPLVFRVEPGHEPDLERYLRQKHPALLSRSTIESSPQRRGGVEVLLATKQRLDNTLGSRLENAWRQLEPEIAAILLEQKQPPPRTEVARQDQAVGVTSHAEKHHGAL